MALLSQFNQRCTSATLIGRSSNKTRDVRMVSQQTGNRTPQRAGAVTVNNSYLTQTRQRSFIEKLVNRVDGFIGRLADDVELRLDLLLRVREMDLGAGRAPQFFELALLWLRSGLL